MKTMTRLTLPQELAATFLEGGKRRNLKQAGLATTSQPSLGILASMGIRPDHTKQTIQALRRRHPLLAAWLEASNRIDGPNHRAHPDVAAKSVIAFIPRRPKRSRLPKAYSHQAHVTAIASRLRRPSPL
jgi:hypothetical protein